MSYTRILMLVIAIEVLTGLTTAEPTNQKENIVSLCVIGSNENMVDFEIQVQKPSENAVEGIFCFNGYYKKSPEAPDEDPKLEPITCGCRGVFYGDAMTGFLDLGLLVNQGVNLDGETACVHANAEWMGWIPPLPEYQELFCTCDPMMVPASCLYETGSDRAPDYGCFEITFNSSLQCFDDSQDFPILQDADGDGIDDSNETGDWNKDGIDDSTQSDVVTYSSAKNKVAYSSTNNDFINFEQLDLTTVPPPPVNLPFGAYSFDLILNSGSKVEIRVYVYDENGNPVSLDPDTKYWKYTTSGLGSPNQTPGWYSLESTVNGNSITFEVTDGGVGDSDGQPNGVVYDPGGIGMSTSPPSQLIPEFSTILLPVSTIFAIILAIRKRN